MNNFKLASEIYRNQSEKGLAQWYKCIAFASKKQFGGVVLFTKKDGTTTQRTTMTLTKCGYQHKGSERVTPITTAILVDLEKLPTEGLNASIISFNINNFIYRC